MQPVITVYSGPGCFKCKYTMNKFDKEGIPYQVVEDPERAATLAENNGLRMSLPVVVVTSNTDYSSVWSDLDTKAIDSAITMYRRMAEVAV